MLAEQANVDFIDIGITSVDHRAVELLPWAQAEELRAIPVRLHPDGDVSVAVADPTDETLLPKLTLATAAAGPAARDDALGAARRLGDRLPAGLGPSGLRHRLG